MIMKTPQESITEINNGQNLSPEASQNFVDNPPENFHSWINENREMLDRRKSLPEFVNSNKKFLK